MKKVFGILILFSLALFFFVTFNVKIAEINKDITYINGKLDENTRQIESISDDIVLLGNNILTFEGELKSLNDRFILFIELFRQ
jgi:peptidoglycan hydrolase CwlO-like protein